MTAPAPGLASIRAVLRLNIANGEVNSPCDNFAAAFHGKSAQSVKIFFNIKTLCLPRPILPSPVDILGLVRQFAVMAEGQAD